MIARNVTMRLKAHSVAEFTRILGQRSFHSYESKQGSKTKSALSARVVAKPSASASGIRRTTPTAIATEVFQRR